MLKVRSNLGFWFVFIPLGVLFYLSLFFTLDLWYGSTGSPLGGQSLTASLRDEHFRIFTWVLVLWVGVFFAHDLFNHRLLFDINEALKRLGSSFLSCLVIAVAFFYLQPGLVLTPRRFLLAQSLFVFVLFGIWYFFVSNYLTKHSAIRMRVLEGYPELQKLVKDLESAKVRTLKFMGNLTLHELKDKGMGSDEVVVLPDVSTLPTEVKRDLYEALRSGAVFENYRDVYERSLRRVYIDQISEAWFLENISLIKVSMSDILKRVMDVVCGILGIVVMIVVLPFVAILLQFEAPGSIFFVQNRVGLGGRVFKLYKFRTMKPNPGQSWTEEGDKRITRTGNFFRKTRLDELPQALNLINGTMSLVGPRPEQVEIVSNLRNLIPFYEDRHLVKPGLSGWAQLHVYAASVEESREKLQYDLYYIKHRSLVFDLEIIIKTIYHLLSASGR